MRILIVEDDKSIRGALELLLEFEGYHVEAVSCGDDALEVLKVDRFELILLDLNTNGISATEFVKQLPVFRPAIGVLSASDRIAIEAAQIGADFFVRKPFDSEDLMVRIENIARLQGLPPRPWVDRSEVILH